MSKQLFFSFLMLSLLISCSTYEGGGDYRYTQSKWCTLERYGSFRCFLADDSTILQPSIPIDTVQFKIGNRYKVYYQSLGSGGSYTLGSSSKLVLIEVVIPVLTKSVELSYSGSNDDPVTFNEKPFIGGGFINLDFGYYKETSTINHDFYLIEDSVVQRKAYMRFVHNAFGDRPVSKLLRLASFPLADISQLSSVDSLVIQYKVQEGEQASFNVALRDSLLR